jgi:hypothetical protein
MARTLPLHDIQRTKAFISVAASGTSIADKWLPATFARAASLCGSEPLLLLGFSAASGQ